MTGIETFKKFFKGHTSEYVIIGGTACELLMQADDLSFRATKDIDLVLIIETLTKEFGETFWNYIKEAEYRYINQSTSEPHFYRFSHPKSNDYPFMIELFSKSPEWIQLSEDQVITPIHIDDSISSLSAILLNNDYYAFLKEGTEIIDDISVLKADHIIPFKAKAWLDFNQRKSKGIHVDSKEIKKHKNDIFRLSVLLTQQDHLTLCDSIKKDMQYFLDAMQIEDINLKQLGIIGMSKDELLIFLKHYYDL